jgi:predicted transcriptional regulator
MRERREMGALEHEVLSELWALGEPATPADVLDALDTNLAYTTIMTILTRLWEKDLVTRERRGRAYAYTPALTEAELTARRMRETLAAASDQKAALSRFVGTLSAREARSLRALLEGGATRRKG